jgi:Glycosyltransferase family 87
MAQLPWITSSRRVKIDRLAWIGVLATFAIAILFAARDLSFAFTHVAGWDLDLVCAAFAALSEGKDPYIAANLGDHLPSIDNPTPAPYPILAVYPAKFLCPIHAAWPNAYVFIYLLLLVCSCAALAYLLLRNVIETALVAIVSICAFAAFRWVALTGNVAILEMPFAILTILAVHQRRFVVGGVALGLMSSLKILPLVGVLAFLILPIGWAQKARAVAASLLTFSAIQLVNIMISGSYGASFFKQLLGRIPNQGSPYIQSGGGVIDFVFRVFGTLGIEKASLIASAIGLCGLAVGGLVTMLAQRTDETDKFATVRLFGLSYLVCMLFLFRLAPYAFAALIPFAIAAVMFPVRALRYICYLVLVLMPWLFGSATMSLNIGLTREFYQTISLVIFLVVAVGLHGWGARFKPGGPLDMRGTGR